MEVPESELGTLKHRVKELERRTTLQLSEIVLLKQRLSNLELVLKELSETMKAVVNDIEYFREDPPEPEADELQTEAYE